MPLDGLALRLVRLPVEYTCPVAQRSSVRVTSYPAIAHSGGPALRSTGLQPGDAVRIGDPGHACSGRGQRPAPGSIANSAYQHRRIPVCALAGLGLVSTKPPYFGIAAGAQSVTLHIGGRLVIALRICIGRKLRQDCSYVHRSARVRILRKLPCDRAKRRFRF